MTVKELIDILSTKDPDAEVLIEELWGDHYAMTVDLYEISRVATGIDRIILVKGSAK